MSRTQGETFFNFLVPAGSDHELEELSCKVVDRDWQLFRMGEHAWALQSYLILKNQSLPVTFSRELRKGCVNLGHITSLSRLRPDPDAFVVALQADYPRLPWAQMHVVQNQLQVRDRAACWLPHWPQPGLVARDPARRGISTAAYVGRSWMQAGTPEDWTERLHGIGVEFRFLTKAWNDLSGIDVLIAIRSFDGRTYPTKPPTKLINAWHAGIPLIAGHDSAYAQIGSPGEDYLVATTLAQAVEAIRKLKTDEALYERIVANGKRKAEAFTRRRIADLWIEFLEKTVALRYAAWAERGPLERARWRYRASLARVRGLGRALLRSRGARHENPRA